MSCNVAMDYVTIRITFTMECEENSPYEEVVNKDGSIEQDLM